MSQLPEHFTDVGRGWRPLLILLHERLRGSAPDYGVLQVKEKFGGLRVYLSYGPTISINTARLAVNEVEEISYKICEDCGDPGSTRAPANRPNGWIRTLCDSCRGNAR